MTLEVRAVTACRMLPLRISLLYVHKHSATCLWCLLLHVDIVFAGSMDDAEFVLHGPDESWREGLERYHREAVGVQRHVGRR